MRKIVSFVMMISAFMAVLIVQAIAAEPKSSITKQPIVASPKAPARAQGIIINQLQAQPGFVFEAGPNNQLMARRAGGGLGASTDCGCSSQSGSCTLTVTGGVALCSKNAGDTCKDDCTFSTTVPSVSGGVMMRK